MNKLKSLPTRKWLILLILVSFSLFLFGLYKSSASSKICQDAHRKLTISPSLKWKIYKLTDKADYSFSLNQFPKNNGISQSTNRPQLLIPDNYIISSDIRNNTKIFIPSSGKSLLDIKPQDSTKISLEEGSPIYVIYSSREPELQIKKRRA